MQRLTYCNVLSNNSQIKFILFPVFRIVDDIIPEGLRVSLFRSPRVCDPDQRECSGMISSDN